jgi:hypothetical protein
MAPFPDGAELVVLRFPAFGVSIAFPFTTLNPEINQLFAPVNVYDSVGIELPIVLPFAVTAPRTLCAPEYSPIETAGVKAHGCPSPC